MAWVSVFVGSVAPGNSTPLFSPTTTNQPWLVAFPDLPEGAVRLYGTFLWGRREAAPADQFRAIRFSQNIWNNGTFIQLNNTLVAGGVSFRVQSQFGASLVVQVFRFDP